MPGFNIVYFPQGEYYIEGFKSFIYHNTVLRGECPTNTTLKINPAKETDSTNHRNNIFIIAKTCTSLTSGYKNFLGGYHKKQSTLIIEDESSNSNVVTL